MEFRLLGPLEVRRDGDLVTIGGPKVRALLAILLLHANRAVTVEQLIDALWGDEPPASARQTVHYFVHRLRKALAGPAGDGEGLLVTHGSGYALRLGAGQLDAERFEQLVGEARASRAGGELAGAQAALDQALALWRGRPLADLPAATFADAEAARLDALHTTALEDRIEVGLALGRHAEMVGELEALTQAHPFRERLRAQLMLALYRSGRRAEALAVYHAARRAFSDELGIEPGLELQRMERAILTQDPALDPPADPGAGRPAQAPPPARRPASPPRGAGALREERKVVTVLVAGLSAGGGDAAPAAMDPEDARGRLATGLSRVRAEVERYGGAVQAMLGGTAFAVFGVPVAHEDDQERAVRVALELAAWFGPGGDEPGSEPSGGLRLRAGVDSGEAMVTRPVPPERLGGQPGGGPLIVGEVVDRAAALQASARPGAVLATASVEQATRGAIDFAAVEPDTGAATWRALGPRSRTGAGAEAPDPSPLVEREQELALLRSLLARVRWGREPQLVTLIGLPGIGKSRLVQELGELVEADPELVTWRQGRSLPYGEAITFDALAEIVKAHAGILESDPAEQTAAKVARAVADTLVGTGGDRTDGGDDGGGGAEAEWVERHLLPLVHQGVAEEVGREIRMEAFAAWRRLLEALAAQRPLVLVFEDLHWADDALLDFIDELADRTGAVPLLVVCAARPELLDRRPEWGGGKRNATTISLAPLSASGTSELLTALLDGAELPAETARQLSGAAGGNPLFVEEYVHMLRDQRLLPGEGDGGGQAERQAPLPVPASVGQLITARLDTLEPGDKALLQDSAVLGEVGWVGALAAISDTERAGIERWLARMERRELVRRVRPSSVAGETEFAFRHVLVRDVAYKQLPRAERAQRHARVATWLESLGADRSADRAELLAHHYQQALSFGRAAGREVGELAERARVAFREAGDRAHALNTFPVAARYYAAAVDLWPPGDPERPSLLLRLGEARCYGEGGGQELLTEARDALLAVGRRAEAADAERILGRLAWTQGRGDARDAHHLRALELAADQPPSRVKAIVLASVASYLVYTERYEEAVRIGGQALELANRFGPRDRVAVALQAIGMAKALRGDYGGLDELRRSLELLDELHSVHAAPAWTNFAAILSMQGDVAGYCEAQSAARRAAERFGSRTDDRRWLMAERATECWWTGRWTEVGDLVEQFIAASTSDGPHYLEALCRVMRGRVLLAGGRDEQAMEDAARALELAREAADPQIRGTALAFQAHVLALSGQGEAARLAVDELLATLKDAMLLPEIGTDLPVALLAVARATPGADPVAMLAGAGARPSRWLEAASAFVAGDFGAAAGHYAAIGSRPDEASACLAGGRALATEDPVAARPLLERALAFYASVGADASRAETERLLELAGAPVAPSRAG